MRSFVRHGENQYLKNSTQTSCRTKKKSTTRGGSWERGENATNERKKKEGEKISQKAKFLGLYV